jgi:hypothetical protein
MSRSHFANAICDYTNSMSDGLKIFFYIVGMIAYFVNEY